MSATVDSVLLFPGQGAFRDGELADVAARHLQIDETFDEIDRVARRLGAEPPGEHLLRTPIPLSRLVHEAPDVLQLGIYGISIGLWRMLGNTGRHFGLMMGHSSGEIAALVAAGAFTVAEGAEIVVHRSAALSALGRPSGGMVMLACSAERAAGILGALDDPLLALAVRNSPQQVVVAGQTAALDAVAQIAGVLGITAKPLRVAYPFHSPVLAQAAAEFAARIRHLEARPLRAMVFSPILGRFHRADDRLADHIATALVAPVAFDRALQRVHGLGVRTFVECAVAGPLRGIVTQQLSDVDVRSAMDYVSTRAAGAAPVLAFPASAPAARLVAPASEPLAAEFAVAEASVVALPVPVAVAAGGGREQLFAELVALYAEALEYPAEVFTEEVKLEEDLGIDSVKQTELMARAADHYGLPEATPDFQLNHYDTMGKLVDYVWAHSSDAATPASFAPAFEPPPAPPTFEPAFEPPPAPPTFEPASKPAAAEFAVAEASVVALPVPVAAPPTGGREQLFAELVDLYAEALEYPAEVFTEEVKLEEDLGIDSVKQTELMARAAEHYGLPETTPDFQLNHYDTMGKLVDYVWAHSGDAAAAPVATAARS